MAKSEKKASRSSKEDDRRQGRAEPYDVQLTETAEKTYQELAGRVAAAERRGDLTSSDRTMLNMVDNALDTIPLDPLNKRYALSGKLSNMFRISKGRLRICWVASSAKREIVILYISETPRKDGDKRDPYVIFTKMVMSGQFNEVFDQLGVRRPDRSAQRTHPGIH